MTMTPRRRPPALPTVLALAAAALSTALATPPLAAQPAAGPAAIGARTPVTLNFVDAEIEAVTRAMAAMIGRQIVVDPRVRGTMTLFTEQPIPVREAYLSYLAALRGLGFTVVEAAGLLRLVPEADAKLQTGTVAVGPAVLRGDTVLTQIFRLTHENPNNLVPVLRPLISPNNTINANPATASLVITDYANNLQRLAQIIAALDQPSATDVDVVPLRHAIATDLAPLVQRLAADAGAAAVPGAPPGTAAAAAVLVAAEPRSNALLVRAQNQARLGQVRALIERLDLPQAGGGPAGNVWVVRLRNAEAARLATVLRAAFAHVAPGGAGGPGSAPGAAAGTAPAPAAARVGLRGGGATGVGAAAAAAGTPAATTPLAEAAAPATGGFIQADPATNSLVITAPEPLYRQVRAMIDQLDSRRAQVMIESLIVEVRGDDAAEFGFQWQGLIGRRDDRHIGGAGTNFGAVGNLLDITRAVATDRPQDITLGQGLNLALLRSQAGALGLAAIARLLQTQTQANIVSAPNLITLDNEEARIVVGANVPFITGQFLPPAGGAPVSPFQTIERRDVGLTLRLRPQIGEGGSVRMVLFQEQSSVDPRVAPGTLNAGPSTTVRSIESTVVVDDGDILVLGGLIEDRYEETRSQVPVLGDLPGIGPLFRMQNRSRQRTNLMVFLRPVIMRDADAAERLSLERYEQIRARQLGMQPQPSALLPIGEAPLLPPLTPGAPAEPAAAAPVTPPLPSAPPPPAPPAAPAPVR
jgi:general secretion pathway protein D